MSTDIIKKNSDAQKQKNNIQKTKVVHIQFPKSQSAQARRVFNLSFLNEQSSVGSCSKTSSFYSVPFYAVNNSISRTTLTYDMIRPSSKPHSRSIFDKLLKYYDAIFTSDVSLPCGCAGMVGSVGMEGTCVKGVQWLRSAYPLNEASALRSQYNRLNQIIPDSRNYRYIQLYIVGKSNSTLRERFRSCSYSSQVIGSTRTYIRS